MNITIHYPTKSNRNGKSRYRRHSLCLPAALIMLVLSFGASAQISVARVEAPPEVTIALPITYAAPAEESPSTLVLRFSYSETLIEVMEVVTTPVIKQGGKTLDYEVGSSIIAIVISGGTAPVPSGTLFYVMMRVKPAAPSGTLLQILNASSHGADRNAKQITLAVASGNIRVIDMPEKHSADTAADWEISMQELLRVIQLYNGIEFHCDTDSTDGYTVGAGDQDCASHNSDYAAADWNISFSELLRMIQLYNSPFRKYHTDAAAEDGFAPGPFGYTP